MKRVFLFLATNFAITLVLFFVWNLIGVGSILDAQGVHLQLGPLLLFCAVFGMGGAFISLGISKWMARRMTGAVVIQQPQGPTQQWLVETVRQHAQAAGIGMPEVAIFDSPDPNAFATGARRDHALVAVSSGLLQRMSREEVAAVLGHEVSHVANGDMITLTLISGVVNTFVFFFSRVIGHTVDRVVFKTERGYGMGYYVTTILAQILLGILASAIVMAFSRRREFRADAGGARLVGTAAMIGALERLKASVDQPHLPEQLSAFGISGGRKQRFGRLFMSHPPLDERIEALKRSG